MQVVWMPSEPDWIWFEQNDEMSGNDPINEFWFTFEEFFDDNSYLKGYN